MAEESTAALNKRIKELEATVASQESVITDQVEKLEMAALAKTIKAETFTRDGKIYKINHPRIIIPGDGKGRSIKVTSAEVAKDTSLQDKIFALEGSGTFTEIKTGEKVKPVAKKEKPAPVTV